MKLAFLLVYVAAVAATLTNCTNPASKWDQYVCGETENVAYTLQDGCSPKYRRTSESTKKGLVVVFHGYTACPDSFDGVADVWVNDGYDVLMPLTVGHGRKPGDCDVNGNICADSDDRVEGMPTSRQAYMDYVAVINEAVAEIQEKENYPKIITTGLSLGGPLANHAVSTGNGMYSKLLIMNPFYGATAASLDEKVRKCGKNTETCAEKLADVIISLIIPEATGNFAMKGAIKWGMDQFLLSTGVDDYVQLSSAMRWVLTAVTEGKDVLPTALKTTLDAANNGWGWGETCEAQRTAGRAGICNFRLLNILAAHSFGSYVLQHTASADTALPAGGVRVMTVQKDGGTRNSLAGQVAFNLKNRNIPSSLCMFRLKKNCTDSTTNECGVPHSMLSRAEQTRAGLGEMYWESTVQEDSLAFFNTDIKYTTDDLVSDPDPGQCESLDVHAPPASLVMPFPLGLYVRLATPAPKAGTTQLDVVKKVYSKLGNVIAKVTGVTNKMAPVVGAVLDGVADKFSEYVAKKQINELYLELPAGSAPLTAQLLEEAVFNSELDTGVDKDGIPEMLQVLEVQVAGREPVRPFRYRGRPGSFVLRQFDAEDVADELDFPRAADKDSHGVPPALQGIWWMEGNPAPDYALTFGDGCETRESGLFCQIKVYEENRWTWTDSFAGRALYAGALATSLTYNFTFDANTKYAQIMAVAKVGPLKLSPPQSFVQFDMFLDDSDSTGDLWIRNSTVGGNGDNQHFYNLRRIIDGYGNATSFFDRYLDETPGTHLTVDRTLDPVPTPEATPDNMADEANVIYRVKPDGDVFELVVETEGRVELLTTSMAGINSIVVTSLKQQPTVRVRTESGTAARFLFDNSKCTKTVTDTSSTGTGTDTSSTGTGTDTSSAGTGTDTSSTGTDTSGTGTDSPQSITESTVSSALMGAAPTCLASVLTGLGLRSTMLPVLGCALASLVGVAGEVAMCSHDSVTVQYPKNMCLFRREDIDGVTTLTFKKAGDCPEEEGEVSKPADGNCMTECWGDWESKPCLECLVDASGFSQLPVAYTKDMLSLKLGQTYTSAWCAGAGVDMTVNPTGWIEQSDGSFTGCEVSKFPGGANSIQSHAEVKQKLKELPGKQYREEVWRGNELGMVISNSQFWPDANPQSVLLGATPTQHEVFRPILDEIFGSCDQACYRKLQASATEMQRRDTLHVQNDIKIWVHNELFEMAFPGEANPIDAQEFIEVQDSLTKLSTITQLIPAKITDLVGAKTIASLRKFFALYHPLVEKHYGKRVAGMKAKCNPAASCVNVLTSSFLDTLLAAGGLSVPGAISTALWVLHADLSEYGDVFPSDPQIDNADPLPFFYENMRFFPPVVGVPYYTTPPDRATDPQGSQTANGKREVLNVALANRDPNVFGADAHKFRVRKIKEYHKKFIGFADYASDFDVAGGAMNRYCPGKLLSLQMGKAWFSVWTQFKWTMVGKPKYTDVTPFVDEFVLEKQETKKTSDRIWENVIKELPNLAAVNDLRFDFYSKAMSVANNNEISNWKITQPTDVLAPNGTFKYEKKTACGLAEEVIVPQSDEGWADVSESAALNAQKFAKGLTFPYSADTCGEWKEGEDKAATIRKMVGKNGVDPQRILVPWTDGIQRTDEGLKQLMFGGVGQHRLEKVREGDPNAGEAVYACYLNFTAGLDVKPGFARLGADAYFAADGSPLHIVRGGVKYMQSGEQGTSPMVIKNADAAACANGLLLCQSVLGNPLDVISWKKTCTCRVPATLGWKHARMAFLGTLNAVITAIDHLYGLHLTVSNAVVTANVETLPSEHAMRQLLTPFGHRTVAINYKASFALVNEFGLIHRSMPLSKKGLRDLYKFARTESAGITWSTMPLRHAQQGMPKNMLPLHEDGDEFYEIVHAFVGKYIRTNYPDNDCAADEDLEEWYAVANGITPNQDLPPLTCSNLQDVLATFINLVTAIHNYLGSMSAEQLDPCFMPWSWREGELCGMPRTSHTQLLTFALTSLKQAKLVGDYTHIFVDQKNKDLWSEFQDNLKPFGERVKARNSKNGKRMRPFKAYDLDYVEISIGI